MALNIKKGDTVLVIAGKDKGKSGKVLVAMPADNSVVVAGVNIVAKHKKPRNANDKGGIIKKENKIDASNVQIICPVCGKATRVAHETVDGKKVRICKKCHASLDDGVKKAVKETKSTTKKTTAVKEPAEKKVEKAPEAKKTTKTTTSSTTKKATTTKKTTKKEVEK